MATVKRFEELEVWQLARTQCISFNRIAKEGLYQSQIPLKDQMDRSSASVMDNIAEGFDRFSKNDFRHFLVMARGSNAEFRSQLYRSVDREVINEKLFSELKQRNEHLGVRLHNFIGFLSRSEFKEKNYGSKPPEGKTNISENPPILYNGFNYDFPEEFCIRQTHPNPTNP